MIYEHGEPWWNDTDRETRLLLKTEEKMLCLRCWNAVSRGFKYSQNIHSETGISKACNARNTLNLELGQTKIMDTFTQCFCKCNGRYIYKKLQHKPQHTRGSTKPPSLYAVLTLQSTCHSYLLVRRKSHPRIKLNIKLLFIYPNGWTDKEGKKL
jgi:hypothetical protein